MTPSFTNKWELRERHPDMRWLAITLALALFATILHFTVEPALAVSSENLEDDSVICAEALTFFLEGEHEVVEYCYSLMTRGL